MPASLPVAAVATPWLISIAICGFIAIYVVAALVAVLHPDQKRRADARAVLQLHIQALWPRKR